MKELSADKEWRKFHSEKIKKIILEHGSDLIFDLEKEIPDNEYPEKEYLFKELKENYAAILTRIQLKLKEAGLSDQIGITPLLMDFYVGKDMELAYHHNFVVELNLYSTGEKYCGFVISPLNFEIFANRLLLYFR